MLDRPHVHLETNDMSTILVFFDTSSGYVDEIDTFENGLMKANRCPAMTRALDRAPPGQAGGRDQAGF